MCLAIPPNSTRSQKYSLPPHWCNYQEVVAAVKAEQQPSSLAAAEQATPAAGRSQCVGPTTSRSFFGSVKSGYGMTNHPTGASFVSNTSPSPLYNLPPATPPPLPQSEYEFDFCLGLGGQMGLSPYIMQSCVNLNNNNESQSYTHATDMVPMNTTEAPEPFTYSITSSLLNENNLNMMASQGTATHRRRRAPQRPGKTATQKERLFVQHNYHDLANDSDAPESASSVENAATEAAANYDVSSSSSSSSHPFPIKLHQILEESEASGLGHIISWQPHGRAFKIHNPTLFTETIMQNYFPKMKKLASLQRQFNLYGFERLTREGPDAGAYYHEAFLRYRPGLSLARMIRKRVKGTGYKAASNPEAEPNLYAFPFMRDITTCGSVSAAAGTTTFLPPSHVTQKPARLSASSISSEGTTELSYYSTTTASSRSRSEESSSLQQQHLPYQVLSSSSWSNPSVTSGNVVQDPARSPQVSNTSMIMFPPPAPGGDNQMTTSASFSADTSFMDHYLNFPQPAQDQLLQDALTEHDISSVDSFMEKYLREEATSLSQQGIDSSSYQQSWPELSGPPSNITMPSLQNNQQCKRSMGSWAPVLGKDLSLDSDVDGFMDRYLALPRATQDSILQDLLCVNEGRLSFQRCLSKNGQRDVLPTGNNQTGHGITSRDGSASCVQLHPPPSTHGVDVTGSDVSQYATTVDVYEDRIDELGQLMAEQGRCLDELTTRSRRLSSENNMLRERLSSSESVLVKQSSPRGSFLFPTRSPLKHIIKNSQRSSSDDATTRQVVQKLNDDNSLLIQQAELLANELTEANGQLAERDESLATLETKLSSSLEKARSLMMEKKMWKVELSQKMKEIDSLQASAKRSNSCRSDITQKAEQYLADRCELESEVAALGTQISFMTSTIDKQAHQLITKQIELEKALEKVCKLEQEAKTAKIEAKNNAEAAQDCQYQLHRSHSHSKEFEQKLIEVRDTLTENEISQHKLRKMNESLRIEVKEMSEIHALQISTWEKGQSKVMVALKEKHCEENQSNQKRIDNLMRVHASLEIENAQCQRDLQSYQHRCSAHEKLIERSGNESRGTIDKLLLKANEVEMKLEACKSIEKELKAKVSMLEEQLASSHVASNDKENTLKGVTDGLRAKLEAIHAENQTLMHRNLCLEEEVEKIQLDCTKEKHRMQQVSEQKVNELSIVCEAMKVAVKNEKIKSQQAEDTLNQMQSLHENLMDQITTEKKELSTKLEKVIMVEREIGKSLMNKAQELNSKVQRLTSEKYQLNHQAKQHLDRIYNLEKVVANGELKLTQFAKQLTRSMQVQERQILKEVDLKKELNTARMEVEKMKKCCRLN